MAYGDTKAKPGLLIAFGKDKAADDAADPGEGGEGAPGDDDQALYDSMADEMMGAIKDGDKAALSTVLRAICEEGKGM